MYNVNLATDHGSMALCLENGGYTAFHTMEILDLDEARGAVVRLLDDHLLWQVLEGQDTLPRSRSCAMFFISECDTVPEEIGICSWNVDDSRWDFAQDEEDIVGHMKTAFSNAEWTADDPSIQKVWALIMANPVFLMGKCQSKNWG